MTAPSVLGAQTPYAGYTFGDLYETLLRSFNLTDTEFSGTDALYTPASAAQVAWAKRYIKDALVYFQAVRQQEWAISRADATATSDYSGVDLPADFGTLIAASIAGQPLTILTAEEYEANLIADSEGGGSLLWSSGGDPTHAIVVMGAQASASTAYAQVLEVYPAQAAAYTVRVVYRASAKALSAATDTIRMPVLFHPLILLHAKASWLAYQNGDTKGAMENLGLLDVHMALVQNIPSADGAAPRLHAAIPRDRARRR